MKEIVNSEFYPIMKVENTKSLGAEVCLVPGTYDDAHDRAVELQAETGMTFIHPYDDEQVIAGQGTIGLEILDQLPDLDAVIVPVGGGGLISGVAFAIKSLRPEVKVYGVQAEGAPSMYRSLHEHKYQTLKNVATFADGIQVKTPGELTYQLCEEYVDDIALRNERFVTAIEDDTAGDFHVLTLVDGEQVLVRSKTNPERCFLQNYLDIVIVPADFGPYEIINQKAGTVCVEHKTMLKPAGAGA